MLLPLTYDIPVIYIHRITVAYNKQHTLEGCIVLNKHNTVFNRSGPLYATGHQSRRRKHISSLQGSLGDRQTDRRTDHATRSVTIGEVEKPTSVIVYGYNKYLLEQSTQIHYTCLSFISIHQMAPPVTEVGDIQLHLSTHLSTP